MQIRLVPLVLVITTTIVALPVYGLQIPERLLEPEQQSEVPVLAAVTGGRMVGGVVVADRCIVASGVQLSVYQCATLATAPPLDSVLLEAPIVRVVGDSATSVYVALRNKTLRRFDFATNGALVPKGVIAMEGESPYLALRSDVLYVSEGHAGVRAVSFRNPNVPAELYRLAYERDIGHAASGIVVSDSDVVSFVDDYIPDRFIRGYDQTLSTELFAVLLDGVGIDSLLSWQNYLIAADRVDHSIVSIDIGQQGGHYVDSLRVGRNPALALAGIDTLVAAATDNDDRASLYAVDIGGDGRLQIRDSVPLAGGIPRQVDASDTGLVLATSAAAVSVGSLVDKSVVVGSPRYELTDLSSVLLGKPGTVVLGDRTAGVVEYTVHGGKWIRVAHLWGQEGVTVMSQTGDGHYVAGSAQGVWLMRPSAEGGPLEEVARVGVEDMGIGYVRTLAGGDEYVAVVGTSYSRDSMGTKIVAVDTGGRAGSVTELAAIAWSDVAMDVSGNHALVTSPESGLFVVDMAEDPPAVIRHHSSSEGFVDVAIVRGVAYLAARHGIFAVEVEELVSGGSLLPLRATVGVNISIAVVGDAVYWVESLAPAPGSALKGCRLEGGQCRSILSLGLPGSVAELIALDDLTIVGIGSDVGAMLIEVGETRSRRILLPVVRQRESGSRDGH